MIFNENVDAACAAQVHIGNDNLCLVDDSTDSNTNGTAYVETGILVLDNYNGKSIKFSSGLGNGFGQEIKVIGDNYITNEEGYGILYSISGLSFVGDGTLTIKSKIPFVARDFNDFSFVDYPSSFFQDKKSYNNKNNRRYGV